ncbi:hypothetical protein [Nonomuraea deserti]|uniref:hypothetical protein n=1 Tax=Nonomuraea deserti TaxID=1848322 RepID=UPI001C7026B8|nr:hypothetical protein [Nonomuraea deserti]
MNHRATLVSDAPFFDDLVAQGKRPRLAVLVTSRSCTRTARRRSSLWDPETWPDRKSLPTLGRIAKDHMGLKVPAKAIDAGLALDAKMNQY